MTTTMKSMFHSDINQSSAGEGQIAHSTDTTAVNALEIKPKLLLWKFPRFKKH